MHMLSSAKLFLSYGLLQTIWQTVTQALVTQSGLQMCLKSGSSQEDNNYNSGFLADRLQVKRR